MYKRKQNGNTIGLVLILIVIVGLIVFALMRVLQKDSVDSESATKSNDSVTQGQEPADELSLKNLGLATLGSIDVTSNALREYDSRGLKGLYIFGEGLEGGRINPNFEFASLKENTEVVSAVDGVVVNIKDQQESNDKEVFIQTFDGSIWIIGYDHIVDLKVSKGDKVKAGDVIGNPARQNNGLLRFEIQINKKNEDGSEVHVCPTSVLDKSVESTILNELNNVLAEWESVSGKDLYADSQDPTGCLETALSPAQAEGRN